MKIACRVVIASALLILTGGCGVYRLQPAGSFDAQCGNTVSVAPVENMTPYHEQGALIRSALIDAANSLSASRYQSDATCALHCKLETYAREVERRDTSGNPLSYRERFALKCMLVQDRFTPLQEKYIDYADAPFVSIDHRSAHEGLARYIWKRFE